MGVKDFLKEGHPTMFVSTDGKIGRISGVSFVRTHVYVRESPKLIPDFIWYWLADKLTYTVSESYDPTHTKPNTSKEQLSTPPKKEEKWIMGNHICEETCVDHWQETELVCPYCLAERSDSWEVLRGSNNESGKAECAGCDKKFEYGTTITYRDGGVETIYYTTYQLEQPNE